jgi:DNA-directed RNA polymerase subunit N (RpoN/RPB10)
MVDIHIPDNFLSNVMKIGILIVMVIMVASFLKPSLTGQFVRDIENLNATVESCKTVVDSQNEQISFLNNTVNLMSVDLNNMTNDLDYCIKVRDTVNNDYVKLREDYNKTYTEYSTIKQDYDDFQEQLNETNFAYSALSKNAANRICCVRNMLEGKEFDSYRIGSDYEVVCSIGGEKTLSCS